MSDELRGMSFFKFNLKLINSWGALTGPQGPVDNQ